MRIVIALLLAASLALPALAFARGPCPVQPVHTYAWGLSVGAQSSTAQLRSASGWATVTDTNVIDCNGDTVGADFDGDYDAGLGGGFFGYGAWAWDFDCDYDLNIYDPPEVHVFDFTFGPAITFVTAEDDQGGPIKIQAGNTFTCLTDGMITPCPDNDPIQCGPTDDVGDCLSQVYVGTGVSCGAGGGDGGFWVFLLAVYLDENGVNIANPPTAGTITNPWPIFDGVDTPFGEDPKTRSASFEVQ